MVEFIEGADLSQRFDDLFPATFSDRVHRKVVLHTTEGSGWPDYDGGKKAPNMTVRVFGDSIAFRQHFPASMPSRALANPPGGVQTNRDGVFQIELVGTCDPDEAAERGLFLWPAASLLILSQLRELLIKVEAATGTPPVDLPAKHGKPWSSFLHIKNGTVPLPTLSAEQWDEGVGYCGHQHVPENVNRHGDPGNININFLLQRGDVMSAAEVAEIKAHIDFKVDKMAELLVLVAAAVGRGEVRLFAITEQLLPRIKNRIAEDIVQPVDVDQLAKALAAQLATLSGETPPPPPSA